MERMAIEQKQNLSTPKQAKKQWLSPTPELPLNDLRSVLWLSSSCRDFCWWTSCKKSSPKARLLRMVQLHVRALRTLRALRALTGLTGPYGPYGPFTGPIRALWDLRAPGNSPEADLTWILPGFFGTCWSHFPFPPATGRRNSPSARKFYVDHFDISQFRMKKVTGQ